MIPRATLAFSGAAHERLKAHLSPGDGLEAAALLLCARTPGPRLRLLVRDAIAVPYERCRRRPDAINWPGDCIEMAIERAENEGLAIVPIHSHPGGWLGFSPRDDRSDREILACLFQALGDLHGSAVMTPDGAVRARLYRPDLTQTTVDLVSVAGHDLNFWWADLPDPARRPIAFTGTMRDELARLSAVVIGVSGTGSIVAEELCRLGFGLVYLIDFDKIKRKNLNRILHATLADATAQRLKVDMFAHAVSAYRGPGVAYPIAKPVLTRDAVLAASQCDMVFSCVDTLEARQIADLIRIRLPAAAVSTSA